MYRRELTERAELLARLGYSKERVTTRLSANTAWDFDLHGRPRHAAEIDRIVTDVFRRAVTGTPSVK